MWTIHVMYWLAIVLVGWVLYRIGVASASADTDEQLESRDDEIERLHADTAQLRADVAALRESRARWRTSAVEAERARAREHELSLRLLDRAIGPVLQRADDEGEPLSMTEADRLAVQAQRTALERESALEGREPLAIMDDAAEPPPRLTRQEEEEGDGPE